MKIGILGYRGRIGSLIVQELQSGDWDNMTPFGGTDKTAPMEQDFFATENPEILFEQVDILIDFTVPEATESHAHIAAKTGKALVIGTTGLSEKQEKVIQGASAHAPILYAANMSVGVNMLMALVEQAAAKLGDDWDIEIHETHHKHKIDSPSGTALALGKAAAGARGVDLDIKNDRSGKREQGHIGFSVQRGGDVAGEHMVTFFGEGERLQLGHVATNRMLFARGALRAAKWLHGRDNGLYSMKDVLGL